jgi:C1A family cysteine protease
LESSAAGPIFSPLAACHDFLLPQGLELTGLDAGSDVCPRAVFLGAAFLLLGMPVATEPAGADEIDDRIAALQARGRQEGWTFTVGRTSASERSMEELCGLTVPADWASLALQDDSPVRTALPASFDWRSQGACPPVRDQGRCGSCWAFATVAPLECNILIRDGVLVDLSEQWLISCNRSNYGCSGGWFAHDYHLSRSDPCGGCGAVLEADFPYAAADLPCACPYPHRYQIVGWAYVGSSNGVPPTEAIKQAIMLYGPVSAAVRVTEPFINYTGGIFNADSGGQVNHAVTLVGWDDRQGAHGVWILRNSWGQDWGEDGYMRIEYGCSSVGFAACYIQYGGGFGPRIEVSPATLDFGSIPAGQTAERAFTLRNVGTLSVSGQASGLVSPFQFVGQTTYELPPGASTQLTVRFSPQLQGMYTGRVEFTGGASAQATVLGRAVGNSAADTCTVAPAVGTGSFTANNTGATTDGSASCAPASQADVWWRFIPTQSGTAIVDTCGSDFDTVVAVYTACGGGEVACSAGEPDCPPAGRVTFTANANQSYYIRVAGRSGQTGNIVLNIALDPARPVISGRTTTAAGAPVPGVTLTGLPGPPVTDENGNYQVEVEYGFTAEVRPQKTAYTFIPPSIRYVAVIADTASQNYTAVPPTFVLRGCVTHADGQPLPGVVLAGLPGNPVTDSRGWYHAAVPSGFSGTATPVRSGYAFNPPARTYQNVTADLLFESYSARFATGNLLVWLQPEQVSQAGAAWSVDGGPWLSSGQRATRLTAGRHTVTYRDILGWTAPPSETVTVLEDDTVELRRAYVQLFCRLNLACNPAWAGEVTTVPEASTDGQYPYGTVVELTAIPLPGFRVGNWAGADLAPATGQDTNTVTLTSDRTVTVNFVQDPFSIYQLTVIIDGPGSVRPQRGFYRAGTVVELVATPDPGHQVKYWSGSDNDQWPGTENRVTMDRQKVVRVGFEPMSDCNSDGIPDRLNIATGRSADCDGDGTPDECESDTDGDGLIDDCDSQEGAGQPPDSEVGTNAGRPLPPLCGAGLLPMVGPSLALLAGLRWRRPPRQDTQPASISRRAFCAWSRFSA